MESFNAKDCFSVKKKELEEIKRLFEKKKYHKALREIHKYSFKYSGDYLGLYLKGEILLALGDKEEARRIFLEASHSVYENNFEALAKVAEIDESTNVDLAKKEYYQVLEDSDYSFSPALLRLAKLERIDQNYVMATKLLDMLPESYQQYRWLELARIAFATHNHVEMAVDLAEIEFSRDPEFRREVYIEQGKLEASFYNYEEAVKLFRSAVRKNCDEISKKAFLEEAKLHYFRGDLVTAKKILEGFNGDDDSLHGEANYWWGRILLKEKEINSATHKFEQAIKSCRGAERDASLEYLGDIELARGNFETARNYFKQIKVFHSKVVFKIIACCMREGNYSLAYQYLDYLESTNKFVALTDKIAETRLILDKVTGKELQVKNNSTFTKQMLDYHEATALYDIQSTFKNKGLSLEKSFFVDILKNVQEFVQSGYQIQGELLDVYDIPYPNLGSCGVEKFNALRVECIPNTFQILRMYPVCQEDSLEGMIRIESSKEKRKMKLFPKK